MTLEDIFQCILNVLIELLTFKHNFLLRSYVAIHIFTKMIPYSTSILNKFLLFYPI